MFPHLDCSCEKGSGDNRAHCPTIEGCSTVCGGSLGLVTIGHTVQSLKGVLLSLDCGGSLGLVTIGHTVQPLRGVLLSLNCGGTGSLGVGT